MKTNLTPLPRPTVAYDPTTRNAFAVICDYGEGEVKLQELRDENLTSADIEREIEATMKEMGW